MTSYKGTDNSITVTGNCVKTVANSLRKSKNFPITIIISKGIFDDSFRNDYLYPNATVKGLGTMLYETPN